MIILKEGRPFMKKRHIIFNSRDSRGMFKAEMGRTILELLAVLCILIIISVGVAKIYDIVISKVKAHNTAKAIKTLAVEHQMEKVAIRIETEVKL